MPQSTPHGDLRAENKSADQDPWSQGFLKSGTNDILDQWLLAEGRCPVHCEMISSIPGLHPISRHATGLPGMAEGRTTSPSVKKHRCRQKGTEWRGSGSHEDTITDNWVNRPAEFKSNFSLSSPLWDSDNQKYLHNPDPELLKILIIYKSASHAYFTN